MSEERLVFPFTIGDYEITTMSVFQAFCVHYRKLVETNNYRGRLIDALEEGLDPEEIEQLLQVDYYGQGQSPAETYELLKAKEGKDVERLGPEHYKMTGEVTK